MEAQSSTSQDTADKIALSWKGLGMLCDELRNELTIEVARRGLRTVFGIPVGGWFVAREIVRTLEALDSSPDVSRTVIVDDIVDSGETIRPYVEKGFLTAALYVKEGAAIKPDIFLRTVARGKWIVFPWESPREIEDSVRRIIEYIGDDPNREGLKDTPTRVVKSWGKLFGGYRDNISAIVKLQAQFSETLHYDQMIVLKNIEFFSTCEHHMMPFFGKVHIGYLPKDKVVGISKLIRLVECYARRLQIQERLTQQIASAITETLRPMGVGVVIEAQHLCMMARGVEKQASVMTTSAMQGNFLEDKVKEEFLRLIGGR